MKVHVKGKNIEVTEAINNKIVKQLSKLDKYPLIKETEDLEAKVVIKVYKESKQTIHVTLSVDNSEPLIAEASDRDLYCAIDKVYEKLEGQVRKHKTRTDKTKRLSISDISAPEEETFEEELTIFDFEFDEEGNEE